MANDNILSVSGDGGYREKQLRGEKKRLQTRGSREKRLRRRENVRYEQHAQKNVRADVSCKDSYQPPEVVP